jgi:threonine dehydrogenase-like Zn-dependent dehydrogenase
MYEAGDVRVETVPDAGLIEPTDAVVAVTRAAICASPSSVAGRSR